MTRATGATLLLFAFGALLRRACGTIFHDDSPETVIASLTLGVTHAPGDPPLTLLGRLWLLLPLGAPALRLNLMSTATFSAAAVLLWYVVARRLDAAGRVAAAAVIGTLLLTAPEIAHQAAVAKGASYGLSLLLLTAAAAAAWSGHLPIAGLALGLLIAHHWMTAAAYAAPLIAAIMLRRRGMPPRRALVLAACTATLGCSTLLATPIRSAARPAYDAGGARTAARCAAHLVRSSFAAEETARPLADRLLQPLPITASLARELGPVAGPAAIAGAIFLVRTGMVFGPALALAVVAPPLIAGLYLALPPERTRLYDTFLLPTWWLLAGLIAAAATRARVRGWPIIIAALVTAHTALRSPAVRERVPARATWAAELARAQLAPLPRDAVLLTVSDLDTFPLWHAQVAEGARPDVLVVNWGLLRHRWYREQVATALGIPGLAGTPGPQAVGLIAASAHRPVFTVPVPLAGLPPALHPSAFHLVARWHPRPPPPAPPRGWIARGFHEAFRRNRDWRADLATGYTLETMQRLARLARTGRL